MSSSRIGVIGAGVMGRGIALVAAQHGLEVRLYDQHSAATQAALAWIGQRAGTATQRIATVPRWDELRDCDILLEAVVENRSVKRRVLGELSRLSREALISSNTSSLSIEDLARAVEHPARFCGLHFCHPVTERALVEVVPGPVTSPDTVDRAVQLAERIGKRALLTRDVPGFALNRLLFPYFDAAVALVRGGIDWLRIERAALEFGMPQGPLAQMDEFGIDVVLRAAAAFHRGSRAIPPESEVLLALYQAGRLGRKSGAGFFRYATPDAPGRNDPEAVEIVRPHGSTPIRCADDELTMRLALPLAGAAARLLEERVVQDPEGIRLALREGLGCRKPAANLCEWSRNIGRAALLEALARLDITAPTEGINRLLDG